MYGKDISEITGSLRSFYSSDKPASILQIRGIEECESRKARRPLCDWNFDTELYAYLDDRAERTAEYWENRSDIHDMLLPSVTAWYGIAEHTAWLGGDVTFSESTSYHHAFLSDISDIGRLKLDPENIWFDRVAGGIEYLKNKWGGRLLPRLRGADAPSDIANAVRGNDLFFDVFDSPDEVIKLADFCAGAMNYYFSRQQSACGMINGGYITGFDIWLLRGVSWAIPSFLPSTSWLSSV